MLKLGAYNIGQLHAVLNILKQSKSVGLDIEEAITHVSSALNNATKQYEPETKLKQKTCNHCNKPMLYCSIIGGYYCKCGYSKLETK